MSSENEQVEKVTAPVRAQVRTSALDRAIRKRAEGVPSYTVPEAAALLSISQEYLYRLIQAGEFPAVRMRLGGRHGRYVVPAKAVEKVLDEAVHGCSTSADTPADVRGGVA
ncbi:DNA binding domain protein, excisionase family [Pseudonocardia dioxanivorans CB1190]|uniref:DNA binding domain protein, excisionase family n=1 Tax=Pseudonocardia dioxanivorans (strain ATCC 55486 / DSM 44775 / JCM 13855 / CB1190) TaxID=675635 RepID=F4CK84_PSEUX|nr:helix-turn-helix domain-containing protein [Pseudonocardia dioxanivorans]AEA22307.1 DNA binding domain protein, excisionase family [Pseudonocardia dioxanivorans CB1190]